VSRGLWFVAGAGAGIYASVRARRVREAFTPDGLRDRWQAMTLGARMFRDEVAQGQSEAETDLRQRLGLVPHGVPELASPSSPEAAEVARTDSRPAVLDRLDDQEGQH
jgi:Family of unknown function (DUF6167)